jgi:hypothetical protein
LVGKFISAPQQRMIALLIFLLAACSPAPTAPVTPISLVNNGGKPGRTFDLLYMFRDESVEATQAYQLASVTTTIGGESPPQTVLQRFPIDGIIVPWDVRPPAALSPDGATLAMVQWDEQIGSVLLIDAKTGQSRAIPDLKVTGLFSPTILGWSLDGSLLYIFDENAPPGKVLVYTLADGALNTLFTLDDGARESGLELLSPDVKHIAYCAETGNRGCVSFAIRPMTVPHTPRTFPIPQGTFCQGYPAFKFSPDTKHLAIACVINLRKFAVELIEVATGARRTIEMPFEINDFEWSADSTRLMIDLCAGNYVNVGDPDCGALQILDIATGTVSNGPAIERTEARRLYWQDDLIIFNESTGGGQEATMYFYDVSTRQSKQFTRNASTYADASFTVMALRPNDPKP